MTSSTLPGSSSDIALAVRPFAGYAARADLPMGSREAALQVARSLLVIGAFVSFTTAGRLVPFHVVSGLLAYAFLFAIQLSAFALTYGLLVRRGGLGRALALYCAGHGPWTLFALAITLACAIPSLAHVLAERGVALRVLPPLVLATAAWGVVVTAACFRAGLALPRGRALLATLLYYLLLVGALATWYALTGQLRAFV